MGVLYWFKQNGSLKLSLGIARPSFHTQRNGQIFTPEMADNLVHMFMISPFAALRSLHIHI